MVAFTYIAKRSGGEWKASRISSEEGPELTADASDLYALQKELRNISIENAAGGAVQTLLSTINSNTLVFQVNVGGATFAAGGGGGGAAAAGPAGGAAEGGEAKKEEKKEESEEEEDEDMGFSLFD